MSDRAVRNLQAALVQQNALVREIHKQQRVYIARDFNMKPEHVFIGTEPCSSSPTDTHVYDLHWDPEKVLCLYEPND